MKKLLFSIFFLTIFAIGTFDLFLTQAIAAQGLTTEEISPDKVESIARHVNVSVISEEPSRRAIECFDVNAESGMIAIGFCGEDTARYVLVYDREFVFQYGYKFTDYGSFAIQWNNGDIVIYLVRGSYAVTLSPSGSVNAVEKVSDTVENSDYWRNHLDATERSAGDSKFLIRNNLGIFNFYEGSYSQLVRIDEDGQTTVLYDVSTGQGGSLTVITVAVIIIAFSISLYLVFRIKKNKESMTSISS